MPKPEAFPVAELKPHGVVTVEEHDEAELPLFVQEYLKKQSIKLTTGTVVVWVKPDRLTYVQASLLKEHFLDDFGVTYRYMLPRSETDAQSKRTKLLDQGEFNLMVEDVPVEPVDPLFLTPGCRLYLPPNMKEPKAGGAWRTEESKPGRLLQVVN